MIVKNEAAIIEDCLRSVLPAVDRYVICDTGSTDATLEIIERFFAAHEVAGEIHRIPFVNFEASRNQALELCRRSKLEFDYIFLVDADMQLVIESAEFKYALSAPAYDVRQTNSISYYNTRVVRRDCPARYIGVTHEYLDIATKPLRLAGAWFLDRACGSNRSDKIERDIRLLTAGLRQEPGNPRYLFYLAQSCKDAGRFSDAIGWYEKRVAAGGWSEEIWYSLYMIAVCHELLGQIEKMMEYCLRAFDYRPTRAEPLWRLANVFRRERDFQACMMFAELAEEIPYPRQDSLFIEDWVYNSGIDEEISISGYYCSDDGSKAKGYAKSVDLSTRRGADAAVRETALRNLFYYIKSGDELFGSCESKALTIATEPGYYPMNPSIWVDDAGIRGIVRSVNYHLESGVYIIHDANYAIRTSNYLIHFDERYDIVSSTLIQDRSQTPSLFDDFVVGFEDCRLFRCRGRYWATTTVRDRCASRNCEIAVLELDDGFQVMHVNVIRDFHPELHQKNWMPCVRNDELYLVYSTDPTIVLRYDFNQRQAHVAHRGVPGPCLENFRGGSQIIWAEDRWVCITHEAVWFNERERLYWHRFVTFDDHFQVTGFTDPFYFHQKGIEFCAGLAHDSRRGCFIASFGVGDSEARLAFLEADAVFDRIRRR